MSIDQNSLRIESRQRTRSLCDLSNQKSEAISLILETMKSDMKKMQEDIKKLQEENTALLKTNKKLENEIKRKNRESIEDYEYLDTKIDVIEKRCGETLQISAYLYKLLEEDLDKLYDDNIIPLEDAVDNVEKEMRESEVEIANLYKLPRENLIKAVMRIGDEIECSVLPSDIIKCYRKSPSQRGELGHVIVKFKELPLRNRFLLAYESNFSSTDVIVRVPLTTRKLELFSKALLSQQTNGYQYVYHQNGKVYMKRNCYSQTICINDMSDIP